MGLNLGETHPNGNGMVEINKAGLNHTQLEKSNIAVHQNGGLQINKSGILNSEFKKGSEAMKFGLK